MNTEWNLDVLYKSFDDPAWEADVKKTEDAVKALHETVEAAAQFTEAERTEKLLLDLEQIRSLIYKMANYAELRESVNTQDGDAMAQMARIMRIGASCAADEAAAMKLLGTVKDVDALAEKSAVIRDYKNLILNAKEDVVHLLSDAEESMISAMDMTGGSAWGNLQSYMTSTVKVDYKGGVTNLSEIRNLAYSADPEERKAAYEAELACYEKIQDAVAFSLNNIKNQVSMLAEKRGYDSPLDQTLQTSRMQRETLDAMMGAIDEYLPVFRKYLKKKGELLGTPDGLRWYDLFAPVGSFDKKYTIEEAKETLVNVFNDFTPELSGMMAEAFDQEWIDFMPHDGKVGGAFCAGVPSAKQSRILTNFDGTFGAVDTLAHELGHAFHNLQIQNERPMNNDMAMQVAETASTFDEVFLGAWALKQAADRGERLALLENDLREKVQCVVDIYSRYLFETAVFEQAKNRFLMAPDLCEMMLDAQDKTYGDGLDPAYRHPYMWCCKSHYYSSGLSFYNFPYAFGNLFAQGLYALYLEDKQDFLPKYKEMLRTTGIHSIEESGKMMGVDLTKKDFWEASLKMIADEIEEFCAL